MRFAIAVAIACRLSAAEFVVDYTAGRFQQTEYQSLLTLGAVTHAPKWERGKSDPPVSLDKAKDLALASIESQLGHYLAPAGLTVREQWFVSGASLARFFRFE